MKTISYTALHYGKDYLTSAIRSVIDAVDEHHILYTAIGSHGSRTSVPCPETRDELYAIAEHAAGSKLRWHDGEWAYEGAQRDSIHAYAPDADVILVVDADEVWSVGLADFAINSHGYPTPPAGRLRLPMLHYWRSFYRGILHDAAFPERVIFPKISGAVMTTSSGSRPDLTNIHHFGYAQRPEIVEYKQLTHGHRSEWRKDDWFNSIFMTNRQYDTHPVGSEFWQPEQVDPYSLGLPEWMREHEYADMGVIGEVIR